MKVENRRKPRNGCKIKASIRTGANECIAYVVDMNEFGLRLLIENAGRTISEDDEVEIHTQEFGLLKGKARWRTSHRVGIELNGEADLAHFHCADDMVSTVEDNSIADELERVADQPDLEPHMARLLKQAVEKIRRDGSMIESGGAKTYHGSGGIIPLRAV